MMKHHAKMHKEGGSAHHKKMMEHHKAMCAGGKYAIGGTVSDKVAMKFENTEMHDGEHHDSAHGTGGVRMSNAGGFKHGGKAKHHYAHGGHVMGAEDNVHGTPKGKTNTRTGEVKESNAGGFKHGGHAAKKHFATGGSVNKQGSAVAMPQGRKPSSKPVHINQLSGTFKKGGKVKKYESGGSTTDYDKRNLEDLSKGAFDKTIQGVYNEDIDTAKYLRNLPSNIYQGAKNLLGMSSMSNADMEKLKNATGSVTKSKQSVTVTPPQKKHGGSIKR
jgi:hypothetical protein